MATLRISAGICSSRLSKRWIQALLGALVLLAGLAAPESASAEPVSIWKKPTTCSYRTPVLRSVNAEIGVLATQEDINAEPRLRCSNFLDGCFGVYWVIPANASCTAASQSTALYITVEPANNTFDIADYDAFPRDGSYRVCTSFQLWDMSGYPYSVTLLKEQTSHFDSFVVKFANRSCKIQP